MSELPEGASAVLSRHACVPADKSPPAVIPVDEGYEYSIFVSCALSAFPFVFLRTATDDRSTPSYAQTRKSTTKRSTTSSKRPSPLPLRQPPPRPPSRAGECSRASSRTLRR